MNNKFLVNIDSFIIVFKKNLIKKLIFFWDIRGTNFLENNKI